MATTFLINSENAAWRIVDDEAVILSADTTYYYSLNSSGTFLWKLLLEQDLSVDELAAGLAEHSGRPADEISPAVENLIGRLRDEQLILAESNSGGVPRQISDLVAEVTDGEITNGGYVAPALEKFDTLEKLIVSGE